MINPCKNCEFSQFYPKGKTGKQHYYKCQHVNGACEKHRKYLVSHAKYLESRRMFAPSDESVNSIEELLVNEWVWVFGKPKHIQFVKSLPLNIILQLIQHKGIKKVIRRK